LLICAVFQNTEVDKLTFMSAVAVCISVCAFAVFTDYSKVSLGPDITK